MSTAIEIHPEVTAAIDSGTPVVALESTIFSHLGLPSPHNREALAGCCDIIRANGAVPAVTAVLDGQARVGLDAGEHPRILGPAHKTGAREVSLARALGWDVGATTVSAALWLAAQAGVRVFATGGIGGVHHGAGQSLDISADLDAIARHQVITVCAGPKYFLDLAATMEVLETRSVPVLGYETDELPAFYSPHSGVAAPARVDDPETLAAVAAAHWDLGGGGLVLTVPVPAEAAIEREVLDHILGQALDRATDAGLTGAEITPMVLDETARLTGGDSLTANLALAVNNARIAARVAGALGSVGW